METYLWYSKIRELTQIAYRIDLTDERQKGNIGEKPQ